MAHIYAVVQMYVLMLRSFKQRKGDLLTWLDLAQVLALSIISGLIWLQMDYKESAIGDRSGFLFFVAMVWMLQPWFNALYSCMSTPALRSFLV